MKESIIGVNVPGGTSLSGLDGALQKIVQEGFQAAELNLSSCPLIIGGELVPPVVAYVKSIMGKYPLKYTGHVGYGLDLRDLEQMELQRRVMFASIDACAALGINPLNFHYEEQSKFAEREQAFFDNMKEAGDYAAKKGIQINIENIEVEDARPAIAMIRALNHLNIGMTLDLGHLFISSEYYGYDFMEVVRDCAPLVRHVHVNDNTGKFEPLRLGNQLLYNTMEKGYRFAFGCGDIHIPPLWGKAPLRDAFRELKKAGFDGVWLCEYYSHLFHPLNGKIREDVLEAINLA